MPTYSQRLHSAVTRTGNAVCVGLDPRFDQLPPTLIEAARGRGVTEAEGVASAYEEFCFRILDVVAPLVPCVKPQAAFFEEWGPPGTLALARVIRRARQLGLVVICDAKRGDIGSTAEAYARGYLAGEDPEAAPWAADALTVNPYLGKDTLEPFVDVARRRNGGIYVLVRTTNPGAVTFQDVQVDGRPLYERVAAVVESLASETRGTEPFGCVGAVVGATWPKELIALRSQMPHAPFLIPGYGAQGGTAESVVAAFNGEGHGAVVNNSRGLIFAWNRKDLGETFGPERWEAAVEAATKQMIAEMARARASAQGN